MTAPAEPFDHKRTPLTDALEPFCNDTDMRNHARELERALRWLAKREFAEYGVECERIIEDAMREAN